MLLTICSQPELRAALRKRASHYYLTPVDQDSLIDLTISLACHDPDALQGDDITAALYRIMHRLAQTAVSRSSRIADDGVLAVA